MYDESGSGGPFRGSLKKEKVKLRAGEPFQTPLRMIQGVIKNNLNSMY